MRSFVRLNVRFVLSAPKNSIKYVPIAKANWSAVRAGKPPPHRELLMLTHHIQRIQAGTHLTRAEAENVAEELLTGKLADVDIARLLSTLRDKGECVDELVGFATVMRRHARPVFPNLTVQERLTLSNELVDTCGTGGSGRNTFNISTAAAFVTAGAGVRVAKHGNRTYSSRSGSADVLEALGVRVDIPTEQAGAAIIEIGIGFLFAPAAHTAARHAAAARKQLAGQTIFNLLGPLTNPAGAAAQVLGVVHAKWVEPMARALAELGTRHAFVVHGDDGLDEISLSGETLVAEVGAPNQSAVARGNENLKVRILRIAPENFGLERAPLKTLAGGDPVENAAIIRAIFAGESGPRRDIVVINAAAALFVTGRAANLREGAELAVASLDSGAAGEKLEALAEFTNR
jgi:anthranilate phosphoribosyltransferase